ncbi:MAG: SPOR domain-containing protein [Chitinophagaceae bacterium]|nr:MAG: SPOR domain-containing protein [Chitinophagaceae bacterium]
MKYYLFLSFFLFPLVAFTQDSIIVHKDVRLDLLIKKQQQINEKTSREIRKFKKGFRLLIITTNKREEAIAAKSKLNSHYPDLKTYLIYQSPYFKLKVGNFITYEEAVEFQNKLLTIFPAGVFIIAEVVELKQETNNSDS